MTEPSNTSNSVTFGASANPINSNVPLKDATNIPPVKEMYDSKMKTYYYPNLNLQNQTPPIKQNNSPIFNSINSSNPMNRMNEPSIPNSACSNPALCHNTVVNNCGNPQFSSTTYCSQQVNTRTGSISQQTTKITNDPTLSAMFSNDDDLSMQN